jgi:hypothetical protein
MPWFTIPYLELKFVPLLYRNRTTRQPSESTGKLCDIWMFAGRKKRLMKVIIQF